MEISTDAKIIKISDGAESAQTTVSSDIVDMAGFNGIILFTTIPTASGTANFIKAEMNDTGDVRDDWYDIAGATVAPATDGDIVWIDLGNLQKRYVRFSIVRAGEAFATGEIFAMLYDAAKRPVDNIDNGINGVLVNGGDEETWNGKIITPTIVAPTADDPDFAIDGTLEVSAYAAVDNETSELISTQIQIAAADDTEFVSPVFDVTVSEDVEYALEGTELDGDTDYIIRARQQGTELGWSDWSATVSFNTISELAFTSITPDNGVIYGGQTVTIAGHDFQEDMTVEIGGAEATEVTLTGTTSLTCVTPTGTEGARDIVLTNPDEQTVTGTEAYEYRDSVPTITGISPASGPNTGATAITITGTEFFTGVAVTVGGDTATEIVVVSETEITCVSPAGTDGAQDVKLTNTDGGTVTETGGFTYTNT